MKQRSEAAVARAKAVTGAVVGAGLVAGLVTCAFVTLRGEDSESAKADFCASLGDFSGAVQTYDTLDPQTTTNDEYESAYDDLEDSWNELVSEADDWASAYDNELTDAYWDLYYAVEDLPGDNTMAENIDQLQPELNAFPDAFQATFDGTGCTTV
jgi:hypothetical protein